MSRGSGFARLSTVFIALAVLAGPVVAAPVPDAADLGRIVVTPRRGAGAVGTVPAQMTVVSAQDIRFSGAVNLAQVLVRVPGVSLRDWYGNGVKTAVDIGGFGEQAGVNTLVLLDGRRLNDVDLSGTDLAQVPVGDIERIEIMRGGAAAVLYGENASGGVVNIITRSGEGAPRTRLTGVYGSHQENVQRLSVEGSRGFWDYRLSGGRFSTQGYRENSFSRIHEGAVRLGSRPTETLSLRFAAQVSDASYGMPGALWQTQINDNGRASARYGRDHSENRDHALVWGAGLDLGAAGKLDLDLTFRRKETDSFFLTSGLYTQRSLVSTYGLSPKYTREDVLFGRDNRFVVGADLLRSDYRSNKYALDNDDDLKNRLRVRKSALGGYVHDEWSALERWTLSSGFRYETAVYGFDFHDLTGWDPDIDRSLRHSRRAAHAGVSLAVTDGTQLFADVSRSFRFPQVDEFSYNDASWQQQLNTDLKPQTATAVNVGVRYRAADGMVADASLFRMAVQDELYYNATGGPTGFGQNQNYDRTRHEGGQWSFTRPLTRALLLSGGYTCTRAVFDGGVYDGQEIPLVPRHKVTLGSRLSLPAGFIWSLQGTYVGERYGLNDQQNAHGRMNAYAVADSTWMWQRRDWTISFGVDNVLNKRYAAYGGWATNPATSADDRFYYPSPERTWRLNVEKVF